MLYQKFRPCLALQSFVECYYIWEHNQFLHQALELKSLPKGKAAIVFNYRDSYQVYNNFHKGSFVPACFLTGQSKHVYTLKLSGYIGMVGVVLYPTAVTYLFGIPGIELTDERIDLCLVAGKQTQEAYEKILENDSPEGKINIVESFLLNFLAKIKQKPDRIDEGLKMIAEKKGILSIDQLAEDLNLSSRQFRRKFTEIVGLSPKYYARMKRFNYLTRFVDNDKKVDWHTIIEKGGYYDQSHLIKDFTDFSGKNPTAFINHNQSLLNFFNLRS